MTTTAGRAYQSMLRSRITPWLTKRGFVAAGGGVFHLPNDDMYAQVGFQKSRGSDASETSFTVNVSVISHRDWALYRTLGRPVPEIPDANADYYLGLSKRIGHLMPVKRDHWWTIRAGDDTTQIANQVLDAIRDYVTPLMPGPSESTAPTAPVR